MSETISLDWIGRTLREIQAEQRNLRTEQALLRQLLSDTTTSLLTVLLERIGGSEALMEHRFDRMEQRLDERLGRIEALLIARAAP